MLDDDFKKVSKRAWWFVDGKRKIVNGKEMRMEGDAEPTDGNIILWCCSLDYHTVIGVLVLIIFWVFWGKAMPMAFILRFPCINLLKLGCRKFVN